MSFKAPSPRASTIPVRMRATRTPRSSARCEASSHSRQTTAMKSEPEGLDSVSELARPFADVYEGLGEDQRAVLSDAVAQGARPFVADDGSLRMPGCALVAAASA